MQIGCNNISEVEEACLVGITENDIKSEFKIYPNPAKRNISISSTNSTSIDFVTIYNQLGQEVLHQTYTTKRIDISQLNQGLFILEIHSNKLKIRKKLIIE